MNNKGMLETYSTPCPYEQQEDVGPYSTPCPYKQEGGRRTVDLLYPWSLRARCDKDTYGWAAKPNIEA